MLVTSKLNSIESKISEALINNENSNKDFTQLLIKKKNYCEIKSIRMMTTQRSNTEKNNLIEEGKKIALMKLVDKMHKYKTKLSYFLKCKKKLKKTNPRLSKISNKKAMPL